MRHPMSKPAIVSDVIKVANRLAELGMPTRENLIEVAGAMVTAKSECTDNDPPGAPGWSSWRMGTRRLREETLSVEGWERDDSDQISSVINRALGVRIAVANTDDGTCIEDRVPQNRSKKGAATDRAISINQGSFMDILDESMTVVPFPKPDGASAPLITWYLCVHCEGDEVLAELSCPVGVEAGFFTGFSERIFILGHGGEDAPMVRRGTPDDTDGTDLEISVTRK